MSFLSLSSHLCYHPLMPNPVDSAHPSRALRYWLFLSVIPFLALCILVWRYGFDAPYMDAWEFVPTLDRFYAGRLSFADLWHQHNEHRIFLPRTVMVLLAWLTHWNLRAELAATLAFTLGTFVCILALWRRTASRTDIRLLGPALLLAGLLVFSPAQYEIWLWGWLLQITMNVFFVVATIVILTGRGYDRTQFVLASLACFAATNSFAAGLILVPVYLGLTLWRFWKVPGSWVYFIAASLWAILLVCLYFIGLKSSAGSSRYVLELRQLPLFLPYVCAYLGAPLANWNAGMAIAIGALGLVTFAGFLTGLIRRHVSSDLAPCLALAAFAIGTALLTAFGRAASGPAQALSSRYIVYSTLFWIAWLGLFSLWAYKAKQKRTKTAWLATILCVAALLIPVYGYGLYRADELHDAFFLGRKALIGEGPQEDLHWLYPVPQNLLERRRTIQEHRLAILGSDSKTSATD